MNSMRIGARVRVQQAPADEQKYGNQDTDGSRSTRHFIDSDATLWGSGTDHAGNGRCCPLGKCRWARCKRSISEVVHQGSGRKLGYGALAKAAASWRCPLQIDAPQKSGSISLHRHRQAETGRWSGHRHGQGAVRNRPLVPVWPLRSSRGPGNGGKVVIFDNAAAVKFRA